MKIELITPSMNSLFIGNAVTALRISRMLKQLGHSVMIRERYENDQCDLLIALHALRSYESIQGFHNQYPDLPLVIVLTGTDLYNHIKTSVEAQQSLKMATRLVVLQNMGLVELPERLHAKTRVIYQSAEKIEKKAEPSMEKFQICIIGNLRKEKDPFRTALAVRRLPSSSRINVTHIGRAVNSNMAKFAISENERNLRYSWVGELPRAETLQILASSHLLSITSRIEGGSNVLCEALASSVPVIASRISGLIGTLGENYPGYFPVGDTRALKELLLRAEMDMGFYESLKEQCSRLSVLVDPERELRSWKELLEELFFNNSSGNPADGYVMR
jgi:putative glycosyltransferase (TIGR04348 family)